MQEDEKKEVTDDDFFDLLHDNVLENYNDKKRPPTKTFFMTNTKIVLTTRLGLFMRKLILMLR